MRSYTNTSAVISRISYIDGDKGVLRYRGYPIEELTGASYCEAAYLVLYGNLPDRCARGIAMHAHAPCKVAACCLA